MKILPVFFGLLAVLGFGLILLAPVHDLFKSGWRTRIPIVGLRWRSKESWLCAIIGVLLLFIAMIGFGAIYK
jgi:hypothetical protein